MFAGIDFEPMNELSPADPSVVADIGILVRLVGTGIFDDGIPKSVAVVFPVKVQVKPSRSS